MNSIISDGYKVGPVETMVGKTTFNKTGRGHTLGTASVITILVLLLAGGAAAAKPVSSCGTISSPGEYVLNTDLINSSSCISITSSNVSFNGAGYTITGTGSNYGVYVYKTSSTLTNVTVKNLKVTNWVIGVYYRNVLNGNISNSDASNNSYFGIYLGSSSNSTVSENTASNNYDGIYLYSSSNSTLSGNAASNNSYDGIYLYSSSNSTLSGNTASNNGDGISIYYSGNISLINNTMSGNKYNFGVYGYQDPDFNNRIDTSNTVDGKPILYIKNGADTVYDSSSNAGSIYCIWCNNVTFKNLTIIKNYYGVLFWRTDNSTVESINVSNNVYGIYLSSSSNSTISGNTASNNYDGIYLYSSSNSTVSGNTASNNGDGISIYYSGNISLINNTMTGNKYNFGVYGYQDPDFNNRIDTSNTVDGKPILYIKNGADTVYDSSSNAGSIYCIWCNNVTFKNLTIIKNYYGVLFWNTGNSTVESINVSNNVHGISLYSSSNSTVSGNTVLNNVYGIYLYSSSNNNTISGNTASNNSYDGIYIGYSSDSTLRGNTASNNGDGISIYYSSNSSLINNTMTGNKYNFGVYGNQDPDFNNGIDTSNTVDGKPILYIKNGADTVYDSSSNAGSIYCIWCNNVTFKNLTVIKNYYGILLWRTNNSTVESINVSNNVYGIYIYSSSNSTIYNNVFKNTNNFYEYMSVNTWNITKTTGTNIVGGPYFGGNFWAYPNGTGFSQTCKDDNKDGICDSYYALDSSNIDYLPLTYAPLTLDIISFPDMNMLPADPDNDGIYEDVNGNGRKDFNDVVLFFNNLEWIPDNEPIEAFDFNRNGKIDFNDIIRLFEEI